MKCGWTEAKKIELQGAKEIQSNAGGQRFPWKSDSPKGDSLGPFEIEKETAWLEGSRDRTGVRQE